MARPRIFVSSTYYDLKHIRASLDLFVDSLGFEPVLSEKGDIAYTPDRPLDESCYREVENSDVLVLLIGGRYGSEASSGSKKPKPSFFDRYESITKKEYEAATNKDIPIYILIEKGVYSEYQTFLRNKEKIDINYAHVESVNVFVLIEDILSRPRNNPVQTFEKFDEVESWLREQWAGLFRELLRRQSQQQQLAGLTTQVTELKQVNETLKKYLEAVMTGTGKQAASRLIEEEERRLEEAKRLEHLKRNNFVRYLERSYDVPFEEFAEILGQAKNLEELFDRTQVVSKSQRSVERLKDTLSSSSGARNDLNEARRLTGKQPFNFATELDRPLRDPRRMNKFSEVGDLENRVGSRFLKSTVGDHLDVSAGDTAGLSGSIIKSAAKKVVTPSFQSKTAAKKPPAKTPLGKKASAKKPSAKKAPAKKAPAKKARAKRPEKEE
jgi:hypothetical protein